MKTTIAMADDHVLLRNGLASLLNDLGYQVIFQADDGKEFIEKIQAANASPHIALMDINMPKMNGYETTMWLKKNSPEVKVLALSMYDDENAIIRMIRCGARGYILKDSDPLELKTAINAIMDKGFYHSELVSGTLIHVVNRIDDPEHAAMKGGMGLTEKQMEILKLLCTEMSIKEIAEQVHLSTRTVDSYRDELLDRLNCKSRIGLVLYAIKNGMVAL
jgi:two-component system, NarL family, invasion response regulator UvrY